METAFDKWLTRDPGYRETWWMVKSEDLCDENGAALYVAEISCKCGKLVGWDDDGFYTYYTNENEDNLCTDCFG